MPNHDYTAPCAYFVTVLAKGDAPGFGDVTDGALHLTPVGEVVVQTWRWLAAQYSYVELDEFCVMPDHFHGILRIVDRVTTGLGTGKLTERENP